jgi:hypothetical protein
MPVWSHRRIRRRKLAWLREDVLSAETVSTGAQPSKADERQVRAECRSRFVP